MIRAKIDKFLLGATLSISFAMNYLACFWNVDTYHEGDKFPSALAASLGNNLFTEVNNQYGFIPTYITVPFLKYFGGYLFISRLSGLLVRFLCLLLAWLLIKEFVTTRKALFLILVISILNPAWMILSSTTSGNGSTWPTTYGILFILLSQYLVLLGLKKGTSLPFFFSAFSSLAAWGCRLEFLAYWALATLVFAYLYRTRTQDRKQLASWFIGSALYLIIFILVLQSHGATKAWMDQTILVWFNDPPAQPHIGFAWVLMNSINFFATAIVYPCIIVISISTNLWLRRLSIAYLILFGSSLLLSISNRICLPVVMGVDLNSWVQDIIFRSFFSPTTFLMLMAIFVSAKLVGKIIRNENEYRRTLFEILLIAGIFSCLCNLHILYSDYVYLFSLPALLTCVYHYSHVSVSDQARARFEKSVLFSLSILILISGLLFVKAETKMEYRYDTPLLIHLVSDNQFERDKIDRIFTEIRETVKPGSLFNFCINGLFVVNEKNYLSADRWVWNLQPSPWVMARFENVRQGDTILACSLSFTESQRINEWRKSGAIKLRFSESGIDMYSVVSNP